MKKILIPLIAVSFIVTACTQATKTQINAKTSPQVNEDYFDDPKTSLEGDSINSYRYKDGLLQIAIESHHDYRETSLFDSEPFKQGARCFQISPDTKSQTIKELMVLKTKIIFKAKKINTQDSSLINVNGVDVEIEKNQIKALMFKNGLMFYVAIDKDNNTCISKEIDQLIPEKPIPETRFLNFPAKAKAHVIEVSLFPFNSTPTPEQQQAADKLRKESLAVAKKNGWFTFENAVKDQFANVSGNPIHYFNIENLYDDEVLNPERPETLLYYDTEKGKRLAGFMYLARTAKEEGPQPGGPLTVWHYHTIEGDICLKDGVREKDCINTKENLFHDPEMMHVWFIDHPKGPFSFSMAPWLGESQQLLDPKFD